MISVDRRYIPEAVKRRIHRIFGIRKVISIALLRATSITGKHYCPVCSSRVKNFLPLSIYYLENLQRYGWKYKVEEAETCRFVELAVVV